MRKKPFNIYLFIISKGFSLSNFKAWNTFIGVETWFGRRLHT